MFRIKRIFVLICFCCISNSCFAAKNISLSYDFPTRLVLSSDHINRIHFAGKQIKKIIGDTSRYNIILSENKKNMFIRLNAERGEIINVSVINIAGKVMDLEIIAAKAQYPTIVNLTDTDVALSEQKQEQQEVEKMLAAMQKGVKGKYYTVVGGSSFNCAALGKNTNCRIIADYRFGKYRGIGLKLKNRGRNALLLDADSLGRILAYAVLLQKPSSCILPKGSEEIIYFVGKEVLDGV